ncbi:hypothetical protein TTRE_0000589001 [Trichuris trichiura]|uniref:Reverse transcriptase domain-containing protein n=1 Tax=Trichuris trichiura TaxID=36087 RepID=A0A077ZDH8_TRITR|nr:hypothetical protein TTRE_0000589001 [Trichuris trichiura]
MAATQRSKGTVRPVMDFRQLNEYIDNFTANSDVCAHKLREWRRQGTNVPILDLRKAYLQIHVDQTFWPYQTVIVKGSRYALTRLGFGVNVAPTIMKVVVNHVLSLTPDVQKATPAYIDDIFVNEDVASADSVKSQLAKYGLSCKPLERLANGVRVLGLKVWEEQNKTMWSGGHEVGEPPKKLTWRTVFSYCGETVGHYPVCGWLRTATALIKRETNNATSRWDEPVRDDQIRNRLLEVAKAMKSQDPVRGRWDVSGEKAKVWVDASALALGIALEVDGTILEDGAWLHDDAGHINMAELDGLTKGLNLALSTMTPRFVVSW